MKLYNGKTLPGFTEDNVIELKRDASHEGMAGISPRYIQDKISNALVAHPDEDNINPFMVDEGAGGGAAAPLADQGRGHSTGTTRSCSAWSARKYEDIVKNGPAGDRRRRGRPDPAVRQLHGQRPGVHPAGEGPQTGYTGNYEEPDERLMRASREKIDIPEGRRTTSRRGSHELHRGPAIDGKKFVLQDQRAAPEGPGTEAVRGQKTRSSSLDRLERGGQATQEKIES